MIQAHHSVNGFEMLPIAKYLQIPLVTFFHGTDIYYFKDLIFKRRLQRLFRDGDMFIVNSLDMQNKVVEMGCAAQKIRINYDGVDINKFKVKDWDRQSTNSSVFTIVICARLLEVKGVEYGIRALALLSDYLENNNFEEQKIVLKIIGDGELRASLEQLVTELNLNSQVMFLGQIAYSDVARELQNSDLAIIPSIHTALGQPDSANNVIREAEACGVPVIVSDIAGLPEMLIDGKTGWLVPEKDSEAIFEKIQWFMADRARCKQFGLAGRVFVEDRFNVTTQVLELEEFYANSF